MSKSKLYSASYIRRLINTSQLENLYFYLEICFCLRVGFVYLKLLCCSAGTCTPAWFWALRSDSELLSQWLWCVSQASWFSLEPIKVSAPHSCSGETLNLSKLCVVTVMWCEIHSVLMKQMYLRCFIYKYISPDRGLYTSLDVFIFVNLSRLFFFLLFFKATVRVCGSVSVISGIRIQFVPVHEPTGWWEVPVAKLRTMIVGEDEMTWRLNSPCVSQKHPLGLPAVKSTFQGFGSLGNMISPLRWYVKCQLLLLPYAEEEVICVRVCFHAVFPPDLFHPTCSLAHCSH